MLMANFLLPLMIMMHLRNWGLVVGVVEGDLEKSIRFIPKKSTQGLRDWLKKDQFVGFGNK